jgi:hypothetical protein
MTKNIMLAASMMLLVTIPGQAFAHAAGTTEPHWRDMTATSTPQTAHTFNAFDATIATPPVAPMTHRYEGGPKTND